MPNDSADPCDLHRFVDAQASNYDDALAELRAGHKRSHWSWYVLPQLRGLGSSAMSVHYGVSGLEEAKAYLAHPVLGARLVETVDAMLALDGSSASQVLGPIDARKFQSCLTLFAVAAPEMSVFPNALAKYFSGVEDAKTLALLARQARAG